MATMKKGVPAGCSTVTPHLIVRNAAEAIEFYRQAFGAEELMRMPMPDGRIMHAELQIGSSRVFLCDEFPDWGARSPQALGGTPVTIHLYVDNADRVFGQAVAAGATATMPLQDQFWGDRYGKVTDPYGHEWSIAMQIEELAPAEIQKRAAAAMQMQGQACSGNK